MNKQIPENPQWLENAEEDIRDYLKYISIHDKFDAILQYYQDEIAKLKRKIEALRKEANRLDRP